MRARVKADVGRVVRDLGRVQGTVRSVSAGVINKHMTRSKRRMVAAMHGRFQISKRRLRRRNLVAKRGRASPRRLTAVGITIVDLVPGRYFFNPNTTTGGRSRITRDRYPIGAVQVRPPGPRGGGGIYSIHHAANEMRDKILARIATTWDQDFNRDLKRRISGQASRARGLRGLGLGLVADAL